jgi:hypothetical protein
MKNLKLLSLLCLMAGSVLISCKKGNKTPASQGPSGAPDPDSVENSVWVTLNMAFESVQSNGDSVFGERFTAAAITQNVLDSAVINAYVKYYDSSNNLTVENASQLMVVNYYVGSIALTSNVYDWTSATNDSHSDIAGSFRYVIIPGNILLTNRVFRGLTKAQIQSLSYDYITSILGN